MDSENKLKMSIEDKEMLYHALDVYAYIIAHERTTEYCEKFVHMLERLSEDLVYDFTTV